MNFLEDTLEFKNHRLITLKKVFIKIKFNIKEKSPQSFHDFILERYSWFFL